MIVAKPCTNGKLTLKTNMVMVIMRTNMMMVIVRTNMVMVIVRTNMVMVIVRTNMVMVIVRTKCQFEHISSVEFCFFKKFKIL